MNDDVTPAGDAKAPATIEVDDALLRSALALLRVGHGAFDEIGDLQDGLDETDVCELIDTAMQRISEWLKPSPPTDNSDVFDAVDVLALVRTALQANPDLHNRHTI